MGKLYEPVTLSPEQIETLNQKLSDMRHDVNNFLSLVVAAAELIRHKPEMTERMTNTVAEQPPKIIKAITQFSKEFEETFGITRNSAPSTGTDRTA
jgi:hypothetical protein